MALDNDVDCLSELLDQPFATLPDLMRLHARERADETALLDEDNRSLSFKQLDQYADRFAVSLQNAGTGPGDVVAVCATNSIDYAVLFVAILRTGAAIAPLPPSATVDSLSRMITNCGAHFVFVDDSVEGIARIAQLNRGTILIGLTAQAPGEMLSDWLAPPASRPDPVTSKPGDCFNIIYSSGTTGEPKGIIHNNGLRWPQIAGTAKTQCRPGTVSLVATPLCSNTTLVAFLPALGGGGTVVIMGKFDAERYLRLAERHRVTHTMLVPVQYQRIMRLPSFSQFDLSSFRLKTCTSAPFSADLKADVLRRWPGGLVEFYGMTEGGGSCMLIAHEHPDKLSSVGQPMPGNDVRIIDQAGKEVPTGEVGEIVGRSAFMMVGYNKAPEKTQQATWIDDQGRTFIRTGDLGRFDRQGFLFVVGRAKDTIISGGFNIFPSDIEAVLETHTDVIECAVTGVPSQQWGETPVAAVVANTGTDPDVLRDWVNDKLGKTQRLSDLFVVDQLPRNGLGKVEKNTLREHYRQSRLPGS